MRCVVEREREKEKEGGQVVFARTYFHVEAYGFGDLVESFLEGGEGVLDEVSAAVRLESLVGKVDSVLHPVLDLFGSFLLALR